MKIKQVRMEKGISLDELEKRTGMESQYLADIENLPADEILLSEAILISRALNLRIRRFMYN